MHDRVLSLSLLLKGLLLPLALVAVLVPGAAAGGLLVADGGFGGLLEIKEHTVRVAINNGIAVTRVEQVFLNTENRAVEALYIFPVPRGASVSDFTMWIGGKEMIGEVVEKERARQIYESYKARRIDPGLLEQTDYKTFEMRIFPIAAGAEQRVRITYYQELEFDHDWATYVYPLATSPRKDLVETTTGKFSLSLEILSAVPIAHMESPSHGEAFAIANHSENYCQASLETTGGDLSRDVVLAYKTARPRTGVDLIASRPEGEDGYFCLTLTAGPELEQPEKGMDYVFILDVSGSMAHQGKLGLSRRSIDAFVQALKKTDRFDVITFNVQATMLFGELKSVSEEPRRAATEFLASQRARGGTNLRPAVAAAYTYGEADRTLNVVVLSDGMTEQREREELMQLIRNRPPQTRVFCIGVGNEVERPLLRQVAEDAGGFAAFVSRGDDFKRQAAAFRRKVARPAARNLRLIFDGAEVYDVEPATLPDLYHGMPLRVYGRYRSAGKLGVGLAASVQGQDFEKTYRFELPERANGNAPIERMWAWHRIQALLRDSRDPARRNRAVAEVTRLGEGYSIATEYTSFIVLENDQEYKRWKIERRNTRRLARDLVGDRALEKRFAAIRERADARLGPDALRSAPREARADPARGTRTRRDVSSRRSTAPFSGGTGGGAIDPVTAGIAAGAIAVALLARRRRRPQDRI